MEFVVQDFSTISFEQIAEVPLCWLVRGHPEGGGFGSAYNWAFVMIKKENKGIVKGMVSDNMLTANDTKTIRDFLKRNDMAYVEFVRKRNGEETKHRLK